MSIQPRGVKMGKRNSPPERSLSCRFTFPHRPAAEKSKASCAANLVRALSSQRVDRPCPETSKPASAGKRSVNPAEISARTAITAKVFWKSTSVDAELRSLVAISAKVRAEWLPKLQNLIRMTAAGSQAAAEDPVGYWGAGHFHPMQGRPAPGKGKRGRICRLKKCPLVFYGAY